MHRDAFDYARKAIEGLDLKGKRVLEIGALDINSTAQGMSIRDLCQSAKSYHGIDQRAGPGVDQVVAASDYDGAGKYDVVITTEALEHTADPESIIACADRALCPGGILIITAAGPDRAPHGWDGRALSEGEPYQNIDPSQLQAWLAEWDQVDVQHNTQARDVYAIAYKPKGKEKAK